MGITTRRSGTPVKFDAEKAARVIGAFVPGAILLRTDKGISSTGQAFAAYSTRYRRQLQRMGEDQKVDLRLAPPHMMNSVKVRGKRVTSNGVEVVIAPGTGTSPQVTPRNGKAHRTGERGPRHNVLGYWIHHGTATMPARPFMGLTREQERELNMLLGKARVFG